MNSFSRPPSLFHKEGGVHFQFFSEFVVLKTKYKYYLNLLIFKNISIKSHPSLRSREGMGVSSLFVFS
jgi:hypothetical protein